MADETVSILKELVQVTRDNNRKAEQDSAIIKDGVVSQKQMLKTQEELKENRKKDLDAIERLEDLAKDEKNDKNKKKMVENIGLIKDGMKLEQAELKKQEIMMQKAADVRGVSTESFMKMREKLEDSNDKLAGLQEQQEKNNALGLKDYALAQEIKRTEKQKARAEKKLEGGRIARAKQQFKYNIMQGKIFGKMLGKLGQLAKSAPGKVGKALAAGGKGLMDMIKKGAMLALLPAILLFLNSPLWTQTKEFIVDKLLPAIEMLYNDYLKPIGETIWGAIMKQWENIKNLFSGLRESFALFGEGEWWEGIKCFFSTIGTFILETIENAFTAVYNFIADIFGVEKTDSVWNTIKTFFCNVYNKIVSAISDAYTAVVNFFTGKFTWISDKIGAGWTNLTDFVSEKWCAIKDWFTGLLAWAGDKIGAVTTWLIDVAKGTFDDVVCFFKDLFTWPESPEGFASKLIDIILLPYNLAIKFLKNIFGFDEGIFAEDFSLGKFITEKISQFIGVFNAIGKAIWASVKAFAPGGDSPIEAFNKTFEAEMSKGGTLESVGTVSDMADVGEMITENQLDKAGQGATGDTTIVNAPQSNVQSSTSHSTNSHIIKNDYRVLGLYDAWP